MTNKNVILVENNSRSHIQIHDINNRKLNKVLPISVLLRFYRVVYQLSFSFAFRFQSFAVGLSIRYENSLKKKKKSLGKNV